MAVLTQIRRPEAAPALFRLLSESALSRAALGACGFPVALIEAAGPAYKVSYVNAAFTEYFGWGEADVVGRPLAAVLFRGEETRVQHVLSDPGTHWQFAAYGKDKAPRPVELTLGAVRTAEGGPSHWVLAFSDRSEAERLRAELAALKSAAAA